MITEVVRRRSDLSWRSSLIRLKPGKGLSRPFYSLPIMPLMSTFWSTFWPVFWFSSLFLAIVAFVVVALRENSKQRAALLAKQPKAISPGASQEVNADDSMENLESFPAESFDFDEGRPNQP